MALDAELRLQDLRGGADSCTCSVRQGTDATAAAKARLGRGTATGGLSTLGGFAGREPDCFYSRRSAELRMPAASAVRVLSKQGGCTGHTSEYHSMPAAYFQAARCGFLGQTSLTPWWRRASILQGGLLGIQVATHLAQRLACAESRCQLLLTIASAAMLRLLSNCPDSDDSIVLLRSIDYACK